MTSPTDRNKDFPALSGMGPDLGSKSGQTVLLSDIPDVTSLTGEATPAPPVGDPTLGSAAVAALGQRYDILAEAGHGAMGSVYKARDRETQQVVALKLVKPEFASDQTMMERFKNELLFARKITHKSVCRVYDFNRIGGVAYTSMEFVEGESLRSVLSRFGGIPLRKAIDLTLQICSGLKEAHAQGIVHRDLKPENVMIDSQGNVKIMDFGIARSMDSATRLTGSMMGTPAYMAPEQVSGKPVDYRTDIYSLGLVLYEVFTGKQAFVAENPVAVALKQVQGTPVPPHEIEPTIPVSIERAILKCLEKEPAKRFQSITELERALTSSGARAVLASGGDAANVLLNRQAIAKPAAAAVSTIAGPRPRTLSKGTSPLVWILLGGCIVAAAGSGLHWAGVSRAAKNLPPPTPLAAPEPPEFALDKTERPIGNAEQPQARRTREAASNAAAEAQASSPSPAPEAAASVAATPAAASGTSAPASATPAQTSPEAATSPPANSLRPRRMPNQDGAGASPNGTGITYLWIGRFMREDRAQDSAKKIEDAGFPSVVVPRRNPNGEFFVVLSGPFGAKKASDAMGQLESLGFTNIHPIKNLILDQKQSP
jgi:cell division septation protein DedD